jgi:hypothetical protein
MDSGGAVTRSPGAVSRCGGSAHGYTCDITGRQRGDGQRRGVRAMEILKGILQAAITVVAIGGVMVLVAGLFMIVFGIATGLDDRINN